VTGSVDPVSRRRDVRVSLAVYATLRDGFVAPGNLAALLQVSPEEAAEALDVVAECSINGEPLLVPGSGSTLLPGNVVIARASADRGALDTARRRGLLRWFRPDPQDTQRLVQGFLAATGRIASSDLAQITGLTQQGALQMLTRMVSDGVLIRGSAARGRHAHFVARPD